MVISDKELIESLGGAAKVAELLGFNKQIGGVQRVHNWIVRGIPPQMKLNFPELFLPQWTKSENSELVDRKP